MLTSLKIMYPGYDYIFPGAKHVTETPIKNKYGIN